MTTYIKRRMTTGTIGADASSALQFDFGVNAGRAIRIRIERTAGDCADFDWGLFASSSATPTNLQLAQLDGDSGVTPGAGLDVDAKIPAPEFVTDDGAGILQLVLTANGGTGGNVFTATVLMEPGRGQFDVVP